MCIQLEKNKMFKYLTIYSLDFMDGISKTQFKVGNTFN